MWLIVAVGPHIRSERDGSEANNLDSLPEF